MACVNLLNFGTIPTTKSRSSERSDMELSLYEIAQEGLWIWALFVIGVLASFLLLAQRNAVSLGSRSIGSIIASPFHYLR